MLIYKSRDYTATRQKLSKLNKNNQSHNTILVLYSCYHVNPAARVFQNEEPYSQADG